MKKFFIVLLIISFIPLAQAAEKLKIRRITSTILGKNASTQDISRDRIASRLISASVSPDHPSSNFSSINSLSIFDGTTERINLSTDHVTASFGPFSRKNAPVFDTDIKATLSTDGMSTATFIYIELE